MVAAVSWRVNFSKLFWGHKHDPVQEKPEVLEKSFHYESVSLFCSSGLQCSDRTTKEEDLSSMMQSWGKMGGGVSMGVESTSPPPSCLLCCFHISTVSPPPPLALHDAALPLQLVGSFLFSRALAVDAQAHVPLLLQGQQLLEQFLHVGVRLGRRLHEGTLPGGGLSLALLRLHLTLGRLVTFVAHEHDGNGLHGAFDGQDLEGHGIKSVRTVRLRPLKLSGFRKS